MFSINFLVLFLFIIHPSLLEAEIFFFLEAEIIQRAIAKTNKQINKQEKRAIHITPNLDIILFDVVALVDFEKNFENKSL